MGIIRLSGKLTLKSLSRVLIFVCLTALLCIAAGLLGNFLLNERGAILEPVTVAIVDEDDSLESRMLLRYLEDLEGYEGLIAFARADGLGADRGMSRGELDAIIRIPKGFIAGVMNGRNDPFVVVLRDNLPLRTGILRVFADVYADMLRTGQIGVYAALDAADEVSGEAWQEMFQKANMRFLSAMLGGKSMREERQVSAVGGSAALYYGAAALVFLTLLGGVLFLDIWQRAASRPVMLRLRAQGKPVVSTGLCYLAGAAFPFLASAALLLAGAGGILKALGALPDINLPSLLPVLLLLVICAAGLMLAVTGFAGGGASGCVFIFVYSLICLFLSGGILPTVYLSPILRTLGYATPHYWLSSLLVQAASGGVQSKTTIISCLWAVTLCAAALIGTARRGKVGKLP